MHLDDAKSAARPAESEANAPPLVFGGRSVYGSLTGRSWSQGDQKSVMIPQEKEKKLMSPKATRNENIEAEATSVEIAEEEIRRRAFEIYLERGEQPGSDLDDWLQAERELQRGDL